MLHPAAKYSFKELLSGLEAEVKRGYLQRNRKGDLYLYNYNKSCQGDGAWNDFTIIGRGIVLHLPSERIAALPFPKFFNYGEMGYDLPELDFTISEKLDGSLGIVFFWDDCWHINTRGAFDSSQSKWAELYFNENINEDCLDRELTYLIEIIDLNNRIVVRYNYEGLVLLSAFNRNTGEETGSEELDETAEKSGFRRPKTYSYTFDKLISVAKSLKADEEGFVITFSNGTRLKIKGEEYCRIHRIISQITPLGVWRMMMDLEISDKIKEVIPEEYWLDYDNIVAILESEFEERVEHIKSELERTKDLSDKELGLSLKDLDPLTAKFIFNARKRNFLEEIRKKGDQRKRLFETFRPDSNILEGYNPSGIMDRFG